MAAARWKSIPCSRRHLRLDVVLQCGQSFRWRENSSGEWLGVVSGHVWRLKQDDTHVYYQVYSKGMPHPQTETECKPVVQEEPNHHVADTQRHRTRETKPQTVTRSRINAQNTPTFSGRKLLLTKTEIKSEIIDHDVKYQPNIFSIALLENKQACDVKSELQKAESDAQMASILEDYFQLDVDVDALYQQWSHADPYFKKTAADFWGIRMLRQDPIENLFSFICSSNNNIARISSMVEKLCTNYGEPIAEVDGKFYHSFPAVTSLAEPGVEEKLRELGFGYRAKFIATSARYIMDSYGEDWVSSLRQRSYEEARVELLTLCGVGAKVADCVCLMSLDKTEAIPVDTHVWQFAARNYLPKLQSAKSVTDKLYQEIGDHFRSLWGQYAGWAHSVLFTAELRHMQSMKSSSDQTRSTGRNQKKKRADSCVQEDVAGSTKRKRATKKK